MVSTIEVVINGEKKRVESPFLLENLLEKFGLNGRFVAVSLNEALIPHSRKARTRLKEGDRIEIVHAVQGG